MQCAPTYPRLLGSGVRMLSSLRLEVPPELKIASLAEAKRVLPFSFEVGTYRHRSLDSRGLLVRYKPNSSRGEDVGASSAAQDRQGHASTPGRDDDGSSSKASPGLRSRRPSDSYLEMVYPFSSNAQLRDQYRRFTTEKLRLGLLLEDMDTFAGDIAARHTGWGAWSSGGGHALLTAFIDRISWLTGAPEPAAAAEAVVADAGGAATATATAAATAVAPAAAAPGEVDVTRDLKMAGQVVWVGRSSMEVLIELSSRVPYGVVHGYSQHEAPATAGGAWQFRGFARFVMVARTADTTAAADVPPLEPVTEVERALQQQGQVHMELRQERRDAHWARRPPSPTETAIIHDLIRTQLLHRAAPPHREAVAMAKTTLRTSVLMHGQDRNIVNVIFGGHLLRLAFEHAFSTAALHAGEYCDPVSMDDVAFLLPVPIGCLLRLTGQVVYTEGAVVRVHVSASKLEPGAPEQSVLTNTFSFAFVARGAPVRRVMPDSMIEAMEYVLGRRQHLEDPASQALAGQANAAITATPPPPPPPPITSRL